MIRSIKSLTSLLTTHHTFFFREFGHFEFLEKKLSKLGPGRKQLDVARWEDQVTVVINELDIVF
jgi:chemotaxis methyl-accepting protein methylase